MALRRSYLRAHARYFWFGMFRDMRCHCLSCFKCASRKGPAKKIMAPLGQLPPVSYPFDRVTCDILGPLPLSYDGNKYIVCFTDYLTKWVEVFPISDMTAKTLARLFVEGIVCRFSSPRVLLTDRETQFTSDLMREICKLCQTQKVFMSAYNLKCNGLVERFNRTLLEICCRNL